jgi:hypothetical protein
MASTVIVSEEMKEMRLSARLSNSSSNGISRVMSVGSNEAAPRRGMVLPFSPLSMCFDDVNYYVDMPAVSLPMQKFCWHFFMFLILPYLWEFFCIYIGNET